MNDQDYIKVAVELADGWALQRNERGVQYVLGPHFSMIMHFNHPIDWVLDALAAQLVRQVDNQIGSWIEVSPTLTRAYGNHGDHKTEGPDRTMNTIKAIVDSRVLK